MIMMEIYAALETGKVCDRTIGAYNIKSFTYQINEHTHARARHARTHKHTVRNSYRGKYVRETRVEG